MIAVLLIAFLISHRQVRSDSIDSTHAEILRRIIELNSSFEATLQQFYKNRRDIGLFSVQTNDHYADLQLFAEIGKIELSLYSRERKALIVAEEIIRRYFINTSLGASDWLPRTKSSVDYIVSRLIQRALEDILVGQDDSRKRIYFLVRRYGSTNPVKYYARNYYLRLRNRKALAKKAYTIKNETLERLKTDIKDMSEEEVTRMLEFIDNLINEADSRYDATEQVPESIERFSRDLQLTELEALRRATEDVSARLDLAVLDKVTNDVMMEEVLTYEDALVQLPTDLSKMHIAEPSFNDLLQEINWRLHRLNWKFEDFISTEFYDAPEQMLRDHGSYHPMALSTLLAESNGLIYTAEKRMLRIVQDAIEKYFTQLPGDRSKQLIEPLVDNSNLAELILRRSFVHALGTGLNQTLGLRKQIYLMLNANEQQHTYLEELARKFYVSLRGKKERYVEAVEVSLELLKRYNNDVLFVIPEAQIRDTLAAVDRLIIEAVEEDDRAILQEIGVDQLEPRQTLKLFIGGYMYEKIMTRAVEMKSKGFGYNQNQIDSISSEDLLRFENLHSAALDDSAGTSIFII